MSERLAPIPTPRAQLWRQLRLQYLPVVIFVAGVAAAVVLWTRYVAPPTLVGEVEAVRTEVRSAQAGTLVGLEVDLLQKVSAGQAMGRIVLSDTRLLDASLAVIRAEIEVLRSTTGLTIEQTRLDWMNRRVQLVALQGQLRQAEANLARSAELHRIKITTDLEFEQAKNARDSIEAQIKAQTELISRLEQGMAAGEPTASRAITTAADSLRVAVQQKEAQLRLLEAQYSPVPLVAPMDGIVTVVYRRTGETVATGEPILQISATRPERIIGFVRQPLPVEPKAGMTAEVRTRTFGRQLGMASVAHVGQHLEPISSTLLAAMRLPVTSIPTEYGLRVLVTVPRDLPLRPGEQVDIILRD